MNFVAGYYSNIYFDTSKVYETAVNSAQSSYHVVVTFTMTRWSSEIANHPYNENGTVEFDIIDGVIENKKVSRSGNSGSGSETMYFRWSVSKVEVTPL